MSAQVLSAAAAARFGARRVLAFSAASNALVLIAMSRGWLSPPVCLFTFGVIHGPFKPLQGQMMRVWIPSTAGILR